LTTSKTKQFCETSSIFEVDNIKNETILRDFLQKWKVECRAGGLVPVRFAIFPFHLSKVLHLPRKSDARSYEVLHLSRKITLPKLKICSKMQPISGNQRPDLLTALMSMSLALRLPREMHLCRSSAYVPRLPSFLKLLQKPSRFAPFGLVHNPLRLPRETTSERPKVLRTRTPQFFALLTSKCASHHNGVHFFDISSDPNMRCFVHSDLHLDMCFAPQRRALFPHLNFKMCSELGVLCHFDLEMCFAPQRRALFPHLNFKMCSEPGVLCHFDLDMCFAPQRRAIFHLSSGQLALHPLLWRAYFSTLRSRKSLEKRNVSRLSDLFAHRDFLSSETFSFLIFFLLLFSSLLFSSLTLPISAFHLSILSEV